MNEKTHVLHLLFIVLIGLMFLWEHSHAQVIQGHVIEEISKKPVPQMVVVLKDIEGNRVRSTSTDEEGFFLLNAPRENQYYIYVRRIGYAETQSDPFRVEKNDTLNAKILVMKETALMDEVVVAVDRYNESVSTEFLEGKNFYERRKIGLGRFYTRSEIQERNLFRLSDLLRMTPGIIVRNGQIWSGRAKCPMKIVLNGMKLFSTQALTLDGNFSTPGFSIDRQINVDNVLGVEVYTSMMGQPQQFGSKTRCGSVLIWTR